MARIKRGQRVLIARTREGDAVTLELPCIVTDIRFGQGENGAYYDTLVRLDRDVMTNDGTYGFRKGQVVGLLESQLEPVVPEGASGTSWDKCLWNPSMIKESNE